MKATTGAVRPGDIPARRKIVFGLVACVGLMALLLGVALGLDVYVHRRVQYDAGVNVWGYRGDVIGRKRPNETRIIVLGGSTAFGYGLRWNQSWPYYLESKLATRRERNAVVRVVNLGIKQPISDILKAAEEYKADAIGLSGLLVKSTVIGKGGLFAASQAAFKDIGGVYLAIIGGAAALETT